MIHCTDTYKETDMTNRLIFNPLLNTSNLYSHVFFCLDHLSSTLGSHQVSNRCNFSAVFLIFVPVVALYFFLWLFALSGGLWPRFSSSSCSLFCIPFCMHSITITGTIYNAVCLENIAPGLQALWVLVLFWTSGCHPHYHHSTTWSSSHGHI